MQRGSRRILVELGLPLPQHLMDLLLQDGNITPTALLARNLQIRKRALQIVDSILRLVLEKLVRRHLASDLRTLPHSLPNPGKTTAESALISFQKKKTDGHNIRSAERKHHGRIRF